MEIRVNGARALGRFRYLEAVPSTKARSRGTLVLLHAFPVHAGMWGPQFASAADAGWHVIAPHLRGFASAHQSEVASIKFDAVSMDDYAADVIDLLDALHIPDAVVAGLSLGGYVAFAMLRHAPRYIRALVLADTRPQADSAEGVEGRKRMIALATARGVSAIADEMIPKLLGETTRRERPAVVTTVRGLALENDVNAINGALHAMMTRPDSTGLLSTIHVPALVIVGDEDGVTPPPVAMEMQRGIPGSQLITIPRAGHLSNLEDSDSFNAALATFLAHRV
jgi:pimeloyl-ACP methyl ester carboxylesterase